MPASDPSERSLIASIAAAKRWSREDPKNPDGALSRARTSFMARFEREVDPDGVLPEAERIRRAECAKTAYFRQLAHRSVKARRRAASSAAEAAVAEAELAELTAIDGAA